jgi:hypothetical protein
MCIEYRYLPRAKAKKTKIIVEFDGIIYKCQVAICTLCLFCVQHIFIYFIFARQPIDGS